MRQMVSAAIIKDNKLLLLKGKEVFYSTPGGKIEEEETENGALV